MKLKFTLSPELLLVLNVAGIAVSAGAIALLMQVDGLVHGLLYSYGLRFDYEWATPYWTFFRLSLGLMCGVAGVSAFSMLYVIMSRRNLHSQLPITFSSRARASAAAVETQRAEVEKEKEQKEKEQEKKLEQEKELKKDLKKEPVEDGVEIAALPMVCNKCGKVFTQPLCMFDFKSGKPRLVNVCPYCNALLAVSGNSSTHQ
jgi:hypothetical protein